MANLIETQVLVNGDRNLVLKIYIKGDGSGEETAGMIVDVSEYGASDVKITGIHSTFSGFVADLLWDATTDVVILHLPDYEFHLNGPQMGRIGGFINNAGAGKTGDIVMRTTGLGNGDDGTLVLEMKKRG